LCWLVFLFFTLPIQVSFQSNQSIKIMTNSIPQRFLSSMMQNEEELEQSVVVRYLDEDGGAAWRILRLLSYVFVGVAGIALMLMLVRTRVFSSAAVRAEQRAAVTAEGTPAGEVVVGTPAK